MSWLLNNMPITPQQSADFYERKGLAAGEQAETPNTEEDDDERIPCACRDRFLYGPPDDCPACGGFGFVDTPNDWCDRCGLTGNCPDCDPDRFRDERDDR